MKKFCNERSLMKKRGNIVHPQRMVVYGVTIHQVIIYQEAFFTHACQNETCNLYDENNDNDNDNDRNYSIYSWPKCDLYYKAKTNTYQLIKLMYNTNLTVEALPNQHFIISIFLTKNGDCTAALNQIRFFLFFFCFSICFEWACQDF